jgi:disulfide oxidoreductase YuzD
MNRGGVLSNELSRVSENTADSIVKDAHTYPLMEIHDNEVGLGFAPECV